MPLIGLLIMIIVLHGWLGYHHGFSSIFRIRISTTLFIINSIYADFLCEDQRLQVILNATLTFTIDAYDL